MVRHIEEPPRCDCVTRRSWRRQTGHITLLKVYIHEFLNSPFGASLIGAQYASPLKIEQLSTIVPTWNSALEPLDVRIDIRNDLFALQHSGSGRAPDSIDADMFIETAMARIGHHLAPVHLRMPSLEHLVDGGRVSVERKVSNRKYFIIIRKHILSQEHIKITENHIKVTVPPKVVFLSLLGQQDP